MTTPLKATPINRGKPKTTPAVIAAARSKAVITETNDPNAPITITEGRARVKRRKLTGDQFKQARAQAVAVTGYDTTSPIYGKQLPEVIAMIEDELTAGNVYDALTLLSQLKARALTRKLIGQARS